MDYGQEHLDEAEVQVQVHGTHVQEATHVKNLMSTDLFTINREDNFQVVRALMDWQRIRHVPVVNDDGTLCGLITDRDLLKHMISDLADLDPKEINRVYREIRAADIMEQDVVTVSPNCTTAEAARLMFENKFGCLPVVKGGGKLVGIITEADFVKVFLPDDL